MTEPLLVGIDLGTTNGKAACYDRHGQLLASAMRGYDTHFPRPGWYEQVPTDWLSALEGVLSEVAAVLGSRRADVAGLAVSSFGPGLVMVDREGVPLADCPTWQDRRCEPQGQRLLETVGSDWIGLGVPLCGFPAKILWAQENQPELAAQAAQMLDIKGYLNRWLTGLAITDPSSGPGADDWYLPAFEVAGWPVDRLSRVVRSTGLVGGLRDDLAKRIGFPPGVPVFAGVNDGAAATLGSGVVRPGQSIITLATNGVARLVVHNRLAVSKMLESYLFSWPYIDRLWLCGGSTLSGAASLQWLADLFGLPRSPEAYDALLLEAAAVPPGSRGVVFLPYLVGRGTPHPDPDRRGGFIHVGLAHGRAELARAVLEGVTFALADILEAFVTLGFELQEIRLTGGGARSPLWRQIIADVLRCPVRMAGGDATLGSAMVAAVALGIHTGFATAAGEMVHPLVEAAPSAEQSALYDQIIEYSNQTRDALMQAPLPRQG